MMKIDLKAKIDNFFDQFSSTRELVDGLIRSKSHPQEILILLCSRIDALASNSAREDEPRQKAFTRFVTIYSGKSKTFESVSIGDLYYELDYHLWVASRSSRPVLRRSSNRIRKNSSTSRVTSCRIASTVFFQLRFPLLLHRAQTADLRVGPQHLAPNARKIHRFRGHLQPCQDSAHPGAARVPRCADHSSLSRYR
jgi:hypothetical protein